MQHTNRLYLSWQDIHQDTYALASQLQNHGPWKKIIAVTRGGLIPTAILVQYLDIRLIDTVCIATYTRHHEDSQAKVFKTIHDDARQILVIDDLVDTGKTFEILKSSLPNATYATVYFKPQGKQQVDYTIKRIPQDVWIVFPWEEEALFTKIET